MFGLRFSTTLPSRIRWRRLSVHWLRISLYAAGKWLRLPTLNWVLNRAFLLGLPVSRQRNLDLQMIDKKQKQFCCFLIALCLSASLAADEIELYVLAGQSNMLGYGGNAEHYPASQYDLDDQVGFYWVAPGVSSSEGKWVHLQAQSGIFPMGHFGIEIAFARKLVRNDLHPFIFKYSLGSTSLARDWLGPGENGMYDDMVASLRGAIASQESMGNTVTIMAFVWIQGESDAETMESASKYRFRLQRLIDDFRQNVAGNDELPVILGVDEQHPWVQAHPIVVESQKEIAAADACTIYTSMIGFPKIDTSHLTPFGIVQHGNLVSDAYLGVREKCN